MISLCCSFCCAAGHWKEIIIIKADIASNANERLWSCSAVWEDDCKLHPALQPSSDIRMGPTAAVCAVPLKRKLWYTTVGFPCTLGWKAFLILIPYRNSTWSLFLIEMTYNSPWNNFFASLTMVPKNPDTMSVQHLPRALSWWMLPSLSNIWTSLNQAVCLLTLLRIQSTSPGCSAKGSPEIWWKKGNLYLLFSVYWLCSDAIRYLTDCWHLGIGFLCLLYPDVSDMT